MTLAKYKTFIGPMVLGLFFLWSLPVSAQTREEKLAVAHKTYDEAFALSKAGTPESYVAAREKLLVVTRLCREIDDKACEADSLEWAGAFSKNLQDHHAALEYYNQSLTLWRQVGDKSDEARILDYIGVVYDALGEMQKALDFYGQSLSLRRQAGDKSGEAFALNNIGKVYKALGQRQKALDFLNQSLLIERQIGDKYGEAFVLNNIGVLYNALGEMQKALDFFSQSLPLWLQAGDKRNEALTLNNIGEAYSVLGQSRNALDFLNQSLLLTRQVGDKDTEALALNNIGAVYRDLGEKQKALDFFSQSLPLWRQVGNRRRVALALTNIGQGYSDLGEKQKALDFFNQSLPLTRQVGDKETEALALNNIGQVSFDLGQKQKALDFFNQSLLIERQIGDKNGEALTLGNVMHSWKEIGNPYLAIFYGKQSVNKYQELRGAINGLDKDAQQTYLKTVEHNYRELADILAASGRFFEAQQVLGLLKDEEYFGYVRRDTDEIKRLTDRAYLLEDERVAIEKYEALGGTLTYTGVQFEKLEREKSILPEGAVFSRQAEYDDLKTKLDVASTAFRLFLEKELVAELGKTVKKEVEMDRALQSKLQRWGNGTVALYTVAGENRYRVILTTSKTQTDGKTEIKAADLNKKIFDFREALQNPAIDPRPLGKELYDILIKPIENDLIGANAKTLLLSLDGTLRYIPIAALSPDGVHYIAEKYQTVVVTSTTRQSLFSEVNPNWQMLGAGVTKPSKIIEPNGTNQISFSGLPEVGTELRAIVRNEDAKTGERGVLYGKRLIDEDFSLKSLEEDMSRRAGDKPKYNVIHFATHFRLGGDTAKSFLLLGDNQAVTLEKVSDDASLSFGDVELVTLSACNTGFGTATDSKADSKERERNILAQNNGKEVDSLATFIEMRGAKAIMATLWSVADESTSLFMTEFYRLKKLNPEMTKADAMQRAQQEMIAGKLKATKKTSGCRSEIVGDKQTDYRCKADAPFAHPYYWAPFVLIGNWR